MHLLGKIIWFIFHIVHSQPYFSEMESEIHQDLDDWSDMELDEEICIAIDQSSHILIEDSNNTNDIYGNILILLWNTTISI